MPAPAAPLKLALVVHSMAVTGSQLAKAGTPGTKYHDISWDEAAELITLGTKYAGDILGIIESAGVTIDKSTPIGKVFRAFGKLGPFLDIILLSWDVESAVTQWQRQDYDAAYATMAGIGGGALIAITELAVVLEWTTLSSTFALATGGTAVVVGVVLLVVSFAWAIYAADSNIVDLIKKTRFGVSWRTSEMQHDVPTAPEWRFVSDGGLTNYSRQLTAFASQSRPINLKKAEISVSILGSGPTTHTLTIELDPPESRDGGHIKADGTLYFRPYFQGEFGNILHRISLSETTSTYGAPNSDSEIPCLPMDNFNFDDMAQYWEDDFAPHLDNKYRITADMIKNPIQGSKADREAQSVIDVEFSPPLSNRTDNDNNIEKMTIKITSPFEQILIGADHYYEGDTTTDQTLTWPKTHLEAKYVPPETETRFRNDDLNFLETGLAEYTTLSRDVVRVESSNGFSLGGD
jgi:hypothetical protein